MTPTGPASRFVLFPCRPCDCVGSEVDVLSFRLRGACPGSYRDMLPSTAPRTERAVLRMLRGMRLAVPVCWEAARLGQKYNKI